MPVIVQSIPVKYADVSVNAVVLTPGVQPWVVLYDSLDETGRSDLEGLVAANGDVLPFASQPAAQTAMWEYRCLNGASWYETYIGATAFVRLPLPSLATTLNVRQLYVNSTPVGGNFTTISVIGDVGYSITGDTLTINALGTPLSTYVQSGYVQSGYVV